MTPANYRLRIRRDAAVDPQLVESISASESPGIRNALALLQGNEVTEIKMTEIVGSLDDQDAVPRLFYWLNRLQQAGQLEYGLRLSDGSDAWLVPQRPGRIFRDVRFDAGKSYRLSRFAFLRRHDRDMQLESPLQPAVLRFRSWLPAGVIALSGQPISCASIIESLPAGSQTDVVAVMELLVSAGFLDDAGEEPPAAAHLWDLHELLFHVRSSTARWGEPFLSTSPHRQPEPPPVKPAFSDNDPIALPPPRLEQWMVEDPPLARVIEDRRSAAAPGSNRLTLAQVSDFCYRTAHPQNDPHRTLPSAGARHELEFYVGAHEVDGLMRGFYHYHTASHCLHRLNADDDPVAELLARAGAAWSTGQHIPHAVIVVASRFPRMASRYASIAYRNTLLDAGIAIEAMYLNATAMRLAPCALGINLPDLFARITGLDPFEETPLAMFALSGLTA